MRAEHSAEEERLQRRRLDLDGRMERLEQREQALNKRQSVLDRRANDVEKMYTQQVEELQHIAEMTQEEARAQLVGRSRKRRSQRYGPHHPPD